MYILERIISIAIFLFFTFLTAYRVAIIKDDYSKIKKILLQYLLLLLILSFLYVPAETADLTRLRIYMENNYSGMSFKEYFYGLFTTPIFTTRTLYYVVTKIGVKELLSVIACFVNYSIILYIIYDYSKNNNIKPTSISNILLLYMFIGQFFEVISGLRNMSAMTVFFFCIYREFFKKKSIISNIPLYLISIGFHSAVVPLVLVRFVYLLFQKEKSFMKRVMNYFLFAALIFFTAKYGSIIIENTANKAQTYLSGNVFSYFWTYLSSILTVILLLYASVIYRKVIKSTIPNNYYYLFIIYLILDIVFCPIEYSIFRRYSRFAVMMFIPISLQSFNFESVNSSGKLIVKKQNIIYYLLMYSILMIEISRGDLCGIRYFTF